MLFASILLAAASAVSAIPLTATLNERQVTGAPCADVHTFLARGWNVTEYPGPREAPILGAICYGLPSCDYENIYYDNSDTYDFCQSVTDGQNYGRNAITTYADRCPNSKLVLVGYSQGAIVAGNILGGGGRSFGATNPCTFGTIASLDRSTSPGNKIGAVILIGDPLHTANQPFNVLSGAPYSSDNARDGDQLAQLNQYADIMRSYCVETDAVCATLGPGPFDSATHLSYFDLYADEAAGWAKYILGY